MEVPFNRAAIERCLVSVEKGEGMGVVLADGYVATAAHVVWPREGVEPFGPGLDCRPFASVNAFVANQPRTDTAVATLETIFLEVCNDLAVLKETQESAIVGGLGLQDLDRGEAVLPLMAGLPPLGADIDFFYHTHTGVWRQMRGRRYGGNGVTCTQGEMPEPGTSGSPVFTANGQVFGVVSWTGGSAAKGDPRGTYSGVICLAAALPNWLLTEILEAQEQEGGV